MKVFQIVGYLPSWSGNVSVVPFDKLTHVNYAFLLPNDVGDGSLRPIGNPGKLRDLVKAAHAHGVEVLISVGGWNDGNDQGFERLAVSEDASSVFVHELIQFVEEYGLDGIDIDWEYPDPDGCSSANFARLMKKLRSNLSDRGKLLTAAVVALGETGEGVPEEIFEDVDFLTLMAYDGSGPSHSPYSYAEASLDYWLGRSLSASKAVLGLPFYARPSWASYKTLVEDDPNATNTDVILYHGEKVHYNGIPTIRQKTRLALERGGGVMIWELSQDTTDGTSLLGAIHDEIAKS